MYLRRYAQTIRHLTCQQIIGRIYFKLRKPKPDRISSLTLRVPKNAWVTSCRYPISILSPTQFRFLNKTLTVATKQDWNNPLYEKLWLYHLHYFDGLVCTVDPSLYTDYPKIINRWILENPPISGNGWEPYPLSRRIVNWIKWHFSSQGLTPEQQASLYQQSSYLIKRLEYHLLGNHLLVNAKGLIFAGLFFENKKADKWYQKGMRLYQHELNRQILPDGGHIEQSPMYHAFMLEDLLDLYNVHQLYGKPIPTTWATTVSKMLDWLSIMTHPDGKPAFFNDSVMNQAPDYKDLLTYAQSLGITHKQTLDQDIYHLTESGYVRTQQNEVTLLMDIGNVAASYLTGHFHPDTLSFELSHKTTRVFVNTGISTYSKNALRDTQRSTTAHNTLTVNQLNSSDIWSAFRCGARAAVINSSVKKEHNYFQVSATHTGYNNYPFHILHTRTWLINTNQIKITDNLISKKNSVYPIQIHLHVEPSFYVTKLESNGLHIIHKTGSPFFRCFFPYECQVDIQDTHWFPEFGKKIPNKKIIISCLTSLPKSFEWYIFHEPQETR